MQRNSRFWTGIAVIGVLLVLIGLWVFCAPPYLPFLDQGPGELVHDVEDLREIAKNYVRYAALPVIVFGICLAGWATSKRRN